MLNGRAPGRKVQLCLTCLCCCCCCCTCRRCTTLCLQRKREDDVELYPPCHEFAGRILSALKHVTVFTSTGQAKTVDMELGHNTMRAAVNYRCVWEGATVCVLGRGSGGEQMGSEGRGCCCHAVAVCAGHGSRQQVCVGSSSDCLALLV